MKKVEHEARHNYTMRQAIEEGFILDVLQSYTTYDTYFELFKNAKAPPEYEVEKAKGRMLLIRQVGIPRIQRDAAVLSFFQAELVHIHHAQNFFGQSSRCCSCSLATM